MDDRGLFIASILDAGARAIASGAASRQAELFPAAASNGFPALRADAEARLAHLAESLAAGTTELFVGHVAWLRDAYAARGVDVDGLHAGLECLRDELEASLEADTHGAVFAQLDAGLAALREPPSAIDSALVDGAPQVELARSFLLAMLEGRREDALVLIEQALAGGALLSELETGVIGRAQVEIGRMWQRGELRIAEEHLGSSIAADALAVISRRIPEVQAPQRRVVVSALTGNSHDIGLQIVRDHLNLGGLETVYLGSSTPIEDVVWTVGEFEAGLVALSTMLPTHVRATANAISALRAEHPDVAVLVGGGVFAAAPELWRAIGADASATDAQDAVRVAERLLTARDSARQ